MNDLHQDRWWVTSDGTRIRIKDMTPRHRRNLKAWLERNAQALKTAEENTLWGLSMHVGGEMALDALDAEISRLMEMSPQEWLEETPFYRKLRRRVRKDLRAEVTEGW